jgi:hypothetical protein
MRRILAVVIILTLLAIDFLEFHDFFEPKTLSEILTALVSIPIVLLMGLDLLRSGTSTKQEPPDHAV